MAGTNSGFNPTEFRNAIKFAMQMGAPNATIDQITFYFDPEVEYEIEDSGGDPFDWDSVPVTDVPSSSVIVDCAVEFIARSSLSAGNAIADFDTPRLLVTILDEDWTSIEGFDYLTASGNTYKVEYVRPKIALFGVDVIQVETVAVDES